MGWTEIPVHVVSLDDVLQGELQESTRRKDFTPTELVAIFRALADRERQLAEQRAQEGRRLGGLRRQGLDFQESSLTADPEERRTSARIARYTGVSRTTLEKAVKVVEAAEKDPERFGHLVEVMDRTGRRRGLSSSQAGAGGRQETQSS